MRKIIAVATIAFLFVFVAQATEIPGFTSEQKYALAEQNLLIALQSENQGLQESAVFLLGELRSSKAVIPLMALLRSGKHESTRVVAALALCRIGDSRGVYAVKRMSSFDDSRHVAQRCAWFYERYVSPGTFTFANTASRQMEIEPLASR